MIFITVIIFLLKQKNLYSIYRLDKIFMGPFCNFRAFLNGGEVENGIFLNKSICSYLKMGQYRLFVHTELFLTIIQPRPLFNFNFNKKLHKSVPSQHLLWFRFPFETPTRWSYVFRLFRAKDKVEVVGGIDCVVNIGVWRKSHF